MTVTQSHTRVCQCADGLRFELWRPPPLLVLATIWIGGGMLRTFCRRRRRWR